jgi:hypothetical protein
MSSITDWIITVEPPAHSAPGSLKDSLDFLSAMSKTEARPKPSAAERKTHPITSGLLDYFPAACAAVAHVSYVANQQHNPGQPMHWAREKSTDQADCLVRHLTERGTFDDDGLRHTAKVAWRALALLQEELEADGAKPGRASVWATKEKS